MNDTISALEARIAALEAERAAAPRWQRIDADTNGAPQGWVSSTSYDCMGDPMTEATTRALTKTYSLQNVPHGQVYVKFSFVFLRTWDNERAYVTVDGQSGWEDRFYYLDPPGACGDSSKMVSGASIFTHAGGTLTIRFQADTDQSISDEGFAIDDVEVWVM